MSGHSHAKTIAHQKAATDQKRGQIFSKMARLITIAVKEGGANVETNYKLKTAIERARTVNMPNDNIERAIKQAEGSQEGKVLSEFSFEAYGPAGIALIIDGITDNKNRVLGAVKQILSQYGGKMVQEGAVRWMFERKGVIVVGAGNQAKEDLELAAIEAGALDLNWQDSLLEVSVAPETLQSVKDALTKQGSAVESATLDWVAKEELPVAENDKSQAEKLFAALDENDDVQDVYSNLKD